MKYEHAVQYNAYVQNDINGMERASDIGNRESSFKFEKPLKKFVTVLCILLAAEFIWLFIVSPCMPLTAVNVHGIDTISRPLVLNAAGLTPRSSYMSVNESHIEKMLQSMPQVERAAVSKRFPDTLNITLFPRKPLALTFAQVNGRTLPALLDEHGVVFQLGMAAGDIPAGLPLISGLFKEDIKPGDTAGPEYAGFFSSLRELNSAPEGLLNSVSEIYVNRSTYNTFDIIIYPVYNETKIRMSALNEDKLRYMFLLLDVFAEKNINVEEIDFRTGTASYKIRGQNGRSVYTQTYAYTNMPAVAANEGNVYER
ncbi:MAG: FtsQ-type POTRA domain-containing protein [Spirochaetaceae bacterium]|jgi:cell division protein FtsQ|nr:FtsQ-type POTRA domain-containing protein [Spirochaetaceae bacterium]